ncbi:MAG: hypothetical protein AAFP07_08715 [Cyanobacteria bacterium J06606_4]
MSIPNPHPYSMRWQANRAQRLFQRTDVVTAVVQDNTLSHTSLVVQAEVDGWRQQ